MRNLLFTSILVLTFCICSFAQTNQTLPCPSISIIQSNTIPSFDKPQVFTVSVTDDAKNYKIEFRWTALNGEIIEGQGTQEIKVLQQQEDIGKNVTVTVEVEGLPWGCSTSESATASTNCLLPMPTLIDEFSEPISQVDKARIDNIFTALENDPNAHLFVILQYEKNISRKTITQRELKIFNVLTKAGIEKERITLLKGLTEKDLIQFYIVPPGATPPTY